MNYNRELILETLNGIEGIEIIQSELDQKDGGIFFLWKSQKVFVSISNTEGAKNKNESRFISPYSLILIYRPSEGMDFISSLDKFRIANYITANSDNVASVIYRESSNVFQITASYNPMIENLPEFNTLPKTFESKYLKYSILYLMNLCFNVAGDIANEIINYLEKNKETKQRLKEY